MINLLFLLTFYCIVKHVGVTEITKDIVKGGLDDQLNLEK